MPKHGDPFPCPTCGNSHSRLDEETPNGTPLPHGEWCWWNPLSNLYECTERYMK